MALGDIIAELREDRGLQQKDLAALLNVSPPTISNYEANVHNPDIENLIKLADIFEVSVDYLLERIRFDVDLKTLSKNFVKKLLTGDVLKQIASLSQQSKNALVEYIELLKLKEKDNEDMK